MSKKELLSWLKSVGICWDEAMDAFLKTESDDDYDQEAFFVNWYRDLLCVKEN